MVRRKLGNDRRLQSPRSTKRRSDRPRESLRRRPPLELLRFGLDHVLVEPRSPAAGELALVTETPSIAGTA